MFVRRIAVIGTGYVGLTTGACLASLGHHVVCADVDEQKIAKLRDGVVPILEPGLTELVTEAWLNRAPNRQSVVGCEVRFKFVENTRASASAVARGSAMTGRAELIVNGCSGSSLLHTPYEKKPVTCVLCASFV